MTRVGILGGTFDPIHDGHLGVAAAARTALGLATVQLAPARVPPHRAGPLVSIYHRFAMVALAAESDASLMACDLGLDSTEPSYTGSLLDAFEQAGHPASQMVFIIGADAFADIATWRYYPAILDRCHFAVVSRPGLSVTSLPARLPALASRFSEPAADWPAIAAGFPDRFADARRLIDRDPGPGPHRRLTRGPRAGARRSLRSPARPLRRRLTGRCLA